MDLKLVLEMNKIIFVITLFLFLSLNSSGQKVDSIKPVRNISIELLGSGEYYSVKFEDWLIVPNFRYSIGLSYVPYFLFDTKKYSLGHPNEKQQDICFIPEISYLIGNSAHKFEIGAGLPYRYWRNDHENTHEYYHLFYSNFKLGYRYENYSSLNVYKVGLVLFHFIDVQESKGLNIDFPNIRPWFGFSYGRRF